MAGFFSQIDSSAPGFLVTVSTVAAVTQLQSSERTFEAPSNRAIKMNSAHASADWYAIFGSSTVVAGVGSSNGAQYLNGVEYVQHLDANCTFIGMVTTSTGASLVVNIALGKIR